VWIAVSVLSTVHTNRRQAKDATSEWSRYAEKPGARGRAIMWLVVRQAVFIVAARITSMLRLRQTATTIRQTAGHNFSDGLLKLGPLYIKLGQIVSCRKGLLGKEWIDAMADLQDRVPARTGQDALDLAYATLEGGKKEFDEMFVDFDPTPLAAASLGQVHRAKLRSNNDEVAVKVQRPYLRQIYDQDFVLLTTIAQFMDRLPGTSKNVGGVESSWTQIFVDAEDILYREIDYRDEAENARRFANDFGLGLGGNATTPTAIARNNKTMPSAAEWLRTPYVYSNISNERLLVMEFVPSIKITNREKLDANNVTAEDRIELADNLARAYLIQFCCNLFFSTDPHPGT
jgi:predicted unusual protein kinase regulating ubiquinone biosynthesis (AarF/ABC1/UbiB family)